MSDLKQRISDEMKAAMRAKQKDRLATIRMILAEIKRIEVDERITPDDARIVATLDKMQKQRRDSISQFEAADRNDLADIEKQELVVIKEFLPQALSEAELISIIDQAVTDSQAQSMQDMGKVMALVKPQVQGRADMGPISQLVKSRLTS
ncbi:GatB/YqeY domain-containing protein [Aliamphritea hakodatensis]|uniref:GatB/YqeY domain-containing protein n=1 Tax=Aliamphritea hakodatensis TaxID=2895352 RepID=UPI0022FD9D89|nr:GatB/YqeY domain-containing protein [Aliamphritea hakodatensis]